MGAPSCTLTDHGRELADRLVECHWQIEVTKSFDERNECEAFAEANGLEKIDRGMKRSIYTVDDELLDGSDDCVLKVAYTLTGWYENRSEVVWWEQMPDEARAHFAPIWDQNPGWNLMPRADTDVSDDEMRRLRARLESVGWAGNDATKEENIGKIDGVPVVLDYGKADFDGDSPAAVSTEESR